MKKLLQKLFGPRPAPKVPKEPVPNPLETLARLRQALDEAKDSAARASLERELGLWLGRSGTAPETDDTAEIWTAAICAAAEVSLAKSWLAGISDPGLLERIAVGARLAEVRLLAATAIVDTDRLKRLADTVRNKDRGVYRHCQGILKALAEQGKRGEQIRDLAARLSELERTCPMPKGQLHELRKLLGQISDGEDLADCRARLERLGLREQAEGQALASFESLLAEAAKLSKSLSDPPWPYADQLAGWKAEALAKEQAAAAQPDWLASHPKAPELTRLLTVIGPKLSALEEDLARTEACRQFLDQLPGRAVGPELHEAWALLPKPEQEGARLEVQERWEAASHAEDQPRPRPPRRHTQAPVDFGAFEADLTALENAVEQGDTHQGFALARKLEQQSEGLRLPRALGERYRRLQGQLGQWRDWARWSGGLARTELIEAAEALLAREPDLDVLAEEVPKLRANWKSLDTHSRASQEQWRRFDQALTQAYQPVLAYRAEQSARLEAAAEAKARFLAEARAWLASLQWDTTPIAEVQRQRAAFRSQWRSLERAGAREERKFQLGFEAFIGDLDRGIEPHVTQENERRQRLIAAAQRLQGETGIREAVEQAKRLQQRWKEEATGAVIPRQHSESQWQEFRKALDAVFVRRDEERASRESAETTRRQARTAKLTEFQAVLDGSPSLQELDAALAEFQNGWEEPPEGSEPRRRDELDRSYTALVRRAQDKQNELHQSRRREILDAITRRGDLAHRIEAAAASGADLEELEVQVRAQWQQLPSLPGETERPLAERLAAAPKASPDSLEEGGRERERLLLDLEILLELDSPPACTQARQARQLEFLQGGFRELKACPAILARFAAWHGVGAEPEPSQGERIARIADRLAQRMGVEPLV